MMIALLVSLLFPASAQEVPVSDEAREAGRRLFLDGRTLYTAGHYQAAIEAWSESYTLTERSELLYNISNAHEKLGDYGRAAEVLASYRDLLEPGEERDVVVRKLAALEQRLAVAPNAAVVRLEAEEPAKESRRRWFSRTAVAAGGVSLITGAALGAGALATRSAYLDDCRTLEGDDQLICTDDAAPGLSRYRALGTASVIALATGAVLTASGVTVWLVSGPTGPVGVGITRRF